MNSAFSVPKSYNTFMIATIIISVVILILVIVVIVILVRDRKIGRPSCGCGCDGCAYKDKGRCPKENQE